MGQAGRDGGSSESHGTQGGRLGWGLQGVVLTSPCPSLVPRYEVQLGDSLLSMSGCSLECWKDMVQKACCPGYWGSQCYGMGGGVPALLLTPLPAGMLLHLAHLMHSLAT